MTRLILFIATATMLMNCAAKQKIQYPVHDISSQSEKLGKRLNVPPFVDKRQELPENQILFEKNNSFKDDSSSHCINSEKYYKENDLANQATNAFIKHFRKKNVFDSVGVFEKGEYDYKITADLYQYYGNQYFSTAAAVGSQFGLVGALLTAGSKTEGEIKIEFRNVRVIDKADNEILNIPVVKKKFNEEMKADGYCWQIYWNTNEKLKMVFEELIERIIREIENTQ